MASPIVVGWDGSVESGAALNWALALAEYRGSPVHIVAAAEPVALEPNHHPKHSHDRLRAMVAQELSALRDAQAQAHPALTVATLAIEQPAVDALVTQSRDADLLVLGSRGASGVLPLIIGSTTLAVAARTECALAAIPPPDDRPVIERGVVVGADGSPVSEGAVTVAFEQASRLGTGLTVVHIWQGSSTPSAFSSDPPEVPRPEGTRRRLLAELTEWLVPWTSKFPEVDVEARIERGNPARVLADVSRRSQLMVVGCRGGAAATRGWLGSVSQGVLHLATVPLVVVPQQRQPHPPAQGN